MTFAERVKFVRGKLQLSQIDLAKELKISNVTVNRWEMKGTNPSFLVEQRFKAYCEQMNIHFEDDDGKQH